MPGLLRTVLASIVAPLVGVAAPAVTGASPADPTPNIVLIISDDQGWADYGFMGHPQIRTPRLDQLARQSVLFRRGYVPTALCRPSLMTLVTGRYAHTHGVSGNDPSPKYAELDSERHRERRARLISRIDRYETLPERLAERGYLSHQSGKWWEGSFRRGGFTHGMTRGFPLPGGRHGDDGLEIGRQGMKPIEDFVDFARAEGRPFFLWYAPFLPHTPHNPPPRFLNGHRTADRLLALARYHAMCAWFDETCGQLIAFLERRGLRENTLIVYVTDNGWIQDTEEGNFAPRSKQTPYEGGVRTPIMFSWPGRLARQDRPEPVSSVDLVPTILSVAGARPIEGLPGLDLWPHLQSGTPIERDALLGEGFAHDIADIDNPEASLLYRWCIEWPWKLILTYDGEVHRYGAAHPRTERGPQLFDLASDPHERRNMASRHPRVVARLAQRIHEWYPLRDRKTIDTLE